LVHLNENRDYYNLVGSASKLPSPEIESLGSVPLRTILSAKHGLMAPTSRLHLRSHQLSYCYLTKLDIFVRSIAATDRFKMDSGSIFLICFVVVFSSLLIGGWWFGHPLLVRYARKKSSQRPAVQHSQIWSGMAQGGQLSPRTSRKVRRHDSSYWKHLTRQ
jgi:hypothetical protein